MITLTETAPAKEFNPQSGDLMRIATSGVTNGATPKIQHRVGPNDAWVDHPEGDFQPDKHLSGLLTVVAPYNRIFIQDAVAGTVVNATI